jgi:hypothetical protein
MDKRGVKRELSDDESGDENEYKKSRIGELEDFEIAFANMAVCAPSTNRRQGGEIVQRNPKRAKRNEEVHIPDVVLQLIIDAVPQELHFILMHVNRSWYKALSEYRRVHKLQVVKPRQLLFLHSPTLVRFGRSINVPFDYRAVVEAIHTNHITLCRQAIESCTIQEHEFNAMIDRNNYQLTYWYAHFGTHLTLRWMMRVMEQPETFVNAQTSITIKYIKNTNSIQSSDTNHLLYDMICKFVATRRFKIINEIMELLDPNIFNMALEFLFKDDETQKRSLIEFFNAKLRMLRCIDRGHLFLQY